MQSETQSETLREERGKAAENILMSFRTVKQIVVRRTKAGLTNHPHIAPRRSRHLQSIQVTRKAVGMAKGAAEEERARAQIEVFVSVSRVFVLVKSFVQFSLFSLWLC